VGRATPVTTQEEAPPLSVANVRVEPGRSIAKVLKVYVTANTTRTIANNTLRPEATTAAVLGSPPLLSGLGGLSAVSPVWGSYAHVGQMGEPGSTSPSHRGHTNTTARVDDQPLEHLCPPTMHRRVRTPAHIDEPISVEATPAPSTQSRGNRRGVLERARLRPWASLW